MSSTQTIQLNQVQWKGNGLHFSLTIAFKNTIMVNGLPISQYCDLNPRLSSHSEGPVSSVMTHNQLYRHSFAKLRCRLLTTGIHVIFFSSGFFILSAFVLCNFFCTVIKAASLEVIFGLSFPQPAE